MSEEKILEQFFVWFQANRKGKIIPEILDDWLSSHRKTMHLWTFSQTAGNCAS